MSKLIFNISNYLSSRNKFGISQALAQSFFGKMLKQVQHDVVFVLISLGLIFIASPAFAVDFVDLEIDEDYLIITDKVIKKIEIADLSIIEIKPFFTILNEKNLMLLNPKKVGKTSFSFLSDDEKFDFEIVIKPNKKEFNDFKLTTKSGFDFLLLDKPPENLELDQPPMVGK